MVALEVKLQLLAHQPRPSFAAIRGPTSPESLQSVRLLAIVACIIVLVYKFWMLLHLSSSTCLGVGLFELRVF